MNFIDTLKSVNLVLSTNEVPLVVGESGIGKTALAKKLAGDNNWSLVVIDGNLLKEGEIGGLPTIESYTITNSNGEKIEKKDFIKNITNDMEENSYSYHGIITEISSNNIVFENQSNNKKYSIDANSNFKFINGRTNEEINIGDIKVDYYIDTYTYEKSKVISILSNIKGEELRKELMKNFALENPLYLTISPIGTKMEIINNDKAILTITFDDLLSDYNNDDRKFEMKIEINSNTVIECKSGINKIAQLEDIALDMIKIKLNKNTIDDEIPIATYFMSSDGN